MTATLPFDWFLERLEPARWETETPGERSGFFGCPACGSRDNLHLTERNGRALVKCFGCDVAYSALVEALEDDAGPTESEPAATDDATRAITIRKVPRGLQSSRPAPEKIAIGAIGQSPLDWYAEYCGVGRALIEALGVEETDDGWLAHTWQSSPARKLRKPGSKERLWSGKELAPRLWPDPERYPLESEIWLVEGETDVIVMREGYGLPAYTAGSASDLLDETEMSSLASLGVSSVVVAYDADAAGFKARKGTVKTAREAGLVVSVAEPRHPITGGPKDWRERWVSNPDPRDVPAKGTADSALDVWLLSHVTPSVDAPLLLDRLDPDDHTILFGDGGTGKGMLAAWWVAELTKEAHQKTVLVLDYEAHARTEWVKRVAAFHGRTDRVLIVQPSRPIWDVAASVREVIVEHRVDYVVVDSALYACAGADAYQPEGATQYSLAIAQFGRPVLTLAHKTKSKEDAGTKYPFGSVFWYNGARLVLRLDAKGYDDPRVLTTTKASHGADFSVEYDWSWVRTGLPDKLEDRPHALDESEGLLAVVLGSDHPMSVKEVGQAYLDLVGSPYRGNLSRDLGKLSQLERTDEGWQAVAAPVITKSKRRATK